jgi:hypothetical protein
MGLHGLLQGIALPYFCDGTEENDEKPQDCRCPTENLSNTNQFGLKFYKNSSVGFKVY